MVFARNLIQTAAAIATLKPVWRYSFLAGVVVLLLAAMSLVALKAVKVKMLPFDNKSEFQVIVDMPEGATLEQTAAVTRELAGVNTRNKLTH